MIKLNYHNITKDDMRNGDGLRVVLWVAGCEHHCRGCQNPVTWNKDDGLHFGMGALMEISNAMDADWCSGITYSGGDPLHVDNRETIYEIARYLRWEFPTKTQWLYTGYLWEDVKDLPVMRYLDILVDGRFEQDLANVKYHWAGSTNQRIIDVKKSLASGEVVLYTGKYDYVNWDMNGVRNGSFEECDRE